MNYLLQAKTPSIRYQTRVDLLGYPADEPQVVSERQAIMSEGIVPKILSRQTETGQWAKEHSYYTPKYVSSHWSMLLLTEFRVDPADARFQRGVDYMLETTAADINARLSTNNLGWSCFWGNVVRYAVYAGRSDDPRLEQIVEYGVRDLLNGGCRCTHNSGLACAWGVVRTLWGLAVYPNRTPEIQYALDQGVTFLLDSFSLIEANYPSPDGGKVHPLWFKLNFPLFYQVDILFTLRVLADLNALDHPGAQAALDWLESQRNANGYWKGVSPYRQRTWSGLADRDETDRWVTLQAASVLHKAGRFQTV